jgi:hypothetical protein
MDDKTHTIAPMSQGTCQKCGEERMFSNYEPARRSNQFFLTKFTKDDFVRSVMSHPKNHTNFAGRPAGY